MIHDYEHKLLQLIDDNIDTATDDELFAGGYLRGHISLAAADCEMLNITDLHLMEDKIKININNAKSELSPQDYLLVCNFMNDIFNKN
ncbi:YfcL family protein [uncultured Photobacterium sp.]|uniref:YfcL family protein n=1 Tax=uncultured Photobacterium sp. TaxID=173973 RepID=UPI00261F187B|nr:YfcL family protein [uncultured Photobacterium sp.]